jgi:hypothetical protein
MGFACPAEFHWPALALSRIPATPDPSRVYQVLHGHAHLGLAHVGPSLDCPGGCLWSFCKKHQNLSNIFLGFDFIKRFFWGSNISKIITYLK